MKETKVFMGLQTGRIYADNKYLQLEDGTIKLSADAVDVTDSAIFAVMKFLEMGNGKFTHDEGDKIYKLKLKTHKKITSKRKKDIEKKD